MATDHMLRPRWGTFSVMDHLGPARLVPEILLYDRLVFPVPTDKADRERWAGRTWQPDALVGARLPTIAPEPANPLGQPGAALHKAISVMFHEVSADLGAKAPRASPFGAH